MANVTVTSDPTDYGSAPTGAGSNLDDPGGKTIDLINSVLAAPSGGGKATVAAPTAANDDSRDAGQKTLDLIREIQSSPAKDAASGAPDQKSNRGATPSSIVGELGSGLSDAAIHAAGLPFDIAAGVENLGIRGVNALTGSSLPLAKGGSQRLSELFGAVDPRMDPANNPPQNLAENIARGVGEGAGGAAVMPGVPGVLGAAGLTGAPLQAAQTAAGPLSAGNVAINAAAGAGGNVAASMVPDRYKPLAQMAGSLAVGGTATPLTEIPAVAHAGVQAGKNFVAPMTAAGRQQLAADTFARGVADPAAAKSALGAYEGPTVPGSNLTSAQVTGDVGVGSMERAAETATPVPFNVRRAAQGEARVNAVKALQPGGDPAKVSEYVRSQLAALDAVGGSVEGGAAEGAREAASGIGQAAGATPETQGNAMRGSLQASKDAAKAREKALWKAVDPDNTLALPVGPVKSAAASLEKSIAGTAKPMDGEEKAIFDTVGEMPAVLKFNDLTALRSRVSAAMKQELRTAGETPTYGRLSALRGSIEGAISSAIEHKVAQESAAVASGTMAQEDTVGAALARSAEKFQAERRAAGTGLSRSVGNTGTFGASSVPTRIGGTGETGRQSSGSSGDQSVPIAPNFDQASADRLKAATAATKERATTFGQGSVGEALATQGQQGNYRILDSAVGAKFFKPGVGGADAVNTFKKAVGNDAEASKALEGYAGLSLRKAALKPDGSIDPDKFASWSKAHADALRAMPDVAAKFSSAAKAAETAADALAAKADALDSFQQGAVGKIMGVSDADSVTKHIGAIFGEKDAIGSMRKLAQTVKNNPDARDGLRKGIADFLASKAISNTNDVKADTFQSFVRQNRAVLSQAFSADEMKGIEAVAAELARVNRVAKQAALPGRSNTAMDLLSQKPQGQGHLSLFAEMMLAGSAGFEAEGIKGAIAGAGAAVGKSLILSARAAGMETVKDLMRGMLLHPELAKAALERASTTVEPTLRDASMASLRRLQSQFGRIGALTANRMVGVAGGR